MSLENNKRIARNTAMLYFRMLITMVVSLFTTRIVLKILGVEDYGIFTVVGGIVAMFSFLNYSMSSATQRFLAFEIGRGDFEKLKRVFSISITIHAIIAVIVLILAETVGLWFLNTKLNIPAERMAAANWIFHFSVLSFLVSIISVPYNATIIAHERMNIFAYISIVQVSLKLLIVFLLQFFIFDKLKLYGVLIFVVTSLVFLLYAVYCRRNHEESKLRFIWDRKLFKQMFAHSGWMLFGTSTNILSTQGINILMNIFFGVGVNAARGIAYQVQGAIRAFVTNFMTAVQPQIIKLYAQNEKEEMYKLVFTSSKFSFFLLYFIGLPVLLEADTIITWWLDIVPDYAILFTQLVIVDLFFVSLFPSISSVSQAAGNIKYYQGAIAIGFTLTFFLTYIFFRLGYPSYVAFIIMIAMSFIGLFARILVLRFQVSFPVKTYVSKVLFRIITVFVVSFPIPLAARYLLSQPKIQFLVVGFSSVLITLIAIWLVGIEQNEKYLIKNWITKRYHKLTRNDT